ncbi:MAG: hypothetical protein COB98_11845 [Flavobacteriaceae bacterium]|nr:MAG: hypothetical protein COB98_11845 [Flavobacteriaceae bacterium]
MEYYLEIIIVVLLLTVVFMLSKISNLKKEVLETESEKDKADIKEKHTAMALEKAKIENLRFTLNPHSFKNTLQTIEHLAKKTYNSVNSLSGIFDYMLYDAKNKFVPLNQEVSFAVEYLKLYRLRLKPTVNVSKKLSQDALNEWGEKKQIAPLIFAHFIENAFKHGDLNSSDSFIQVIIDTIDENTLVYSVRNKIAEKATNKKGGLGNGTFKERLELLYENNFEYDYSVTNNVYTANLKLTINDK